ncbi:hypothetical protein D8B34_00115 [Verminephrobacter eiseniae]|nr:hypothetical protein ET532_009650 [Verminephrobacter sp. Larva24]MCW5231200.1 hypothetical protein [Verminephrobacter eiseniae]MCW5292931.1 hypothetical protein [Verminephrobacter eiseniae]MCW8185828.1 hypothetical protein [Verminephrobacter eiseniae]MCW8224599.1 hypothetical protein [Verminephrobacter eiseniae]
MMVPAFSDPGLYPRVWAPLTDRITHTALNPQAEITPTTRPTALPGKAFKPPGLPPRLCPATAPPRSKKPMRTMGWRASGAHSAGGSASPKPETGPRCSPRVGAESWPGFGLPATAAWHKRCSCIRP